MSYHIWDIRQIDHRQRIGYPKRREKNRGLWSREDWGSFLASSPPRADPSLAGLPIPISLIILADIAGIQLDKYNEVVQRTLASRQQLVTC